MSEDRKDKVSPKAAFELCVDRYECVLSDLVRHIARISAEIDYQDFQNGVKNGYIKGEQKEPKP